MPRPTLEFARLELRKHAPFVPGFAALFAMTLVLAAAGTRRAGLGAADGLDGALMFWLVLGLPLAAVVLGAETGAAQRCELTGRAEALLPLSPLERSKGALLSVAVQVAAFALLIAAAAALDPAIRGVVARGEAWGIGSPFLRPLILTTGVAAALALLTSFVWSYGLGNAVLGGAAAFVLTLPLAAALVWGQGLELIEGARGTFGWLRFAAVAGGALAAEWALLKRLSPWLGRRAWPGWRALAALPFVALAVYPVTLLCLATQEHRILDGMRLLARPLYVVAPGAAWIETAALAQTRRGALLELSPDGKRRELIPALPRRDAHAWVQSPWSGQISEVARDADGALWIRRTLWEAGTGERMELWRDAGGKTALAYQGPEPERLWFAWSGGKLGFRDAAHPDLFVPLGKDGRPGPARRARSIAIPPKDEGPRHELRVRGGVFRDTGSTIVFAGPDGRRKDLGAFAK